MAERIVKSHEVGEIVDAKIVGDDIQVTVCFTNTNTNEKHNEYFIKSYKANDLDAKIQKMQALLERWVNVYSKMFVSPEIPVYWDTKTLLKEAKEVKDGQ